MRTTIVRWIVAGLALGGGVWVTGCGGDGGEGSERTPDGGGPPADGGGPDAAPDGGSASDLCLRDRDCPDDRYCRVEDGSAEGRCVPGCRTRPDSCAAADPETRCDPQTRECRLPPCGADDDCPPDAWCRDGECVPGCRVAPDNCPSEDDRRAACDPETRTCVPFVACCDAFDACSLALPTACEGQALEGVHACDPLPCTARCARDDDCGAGAYCDRNGRCRAGCRPGVRESCPADLACDPDTRECVERPCAADDACEPWQYCAVERGVCAEGCRRDADACPAPARCAPDRRCRPWCREDAQCGEAGYCDPAIESCRPRCAPATHAPCRPEERCDPDTRRCVLGCRPDAADLGERDDAPDRAAPVELAPAGAGRAATLADRGVCPGDVDFVAVPLEAGERVQVTLTYDPADGALGLTLRGPDGAVLAADESPAAPKRLRFPALGGDAAVAAGDHLVEVRGLDVPRRVPYRLEIATVPADGCFPDAHDPGDDRPAGARPAGRRQRPDHADAFTGSLCGDDPDWFCFPMGADDGLEATLVAPAGCSPLQGGLYARARFEADPAAAPAYALTEGPPADGARVYRFTGLPDAGAFTAGEWCLRLRAAPEAGAGARCEDYHLTLAFHRRGAGCTDAVEPNDTLDQAAPLDREGPLADATGRLPASRDLEYPRPLRLCTGDVDLFRLTAEPDDTFEAWIRPAEGDDAEGELEIAFLDAQGRPQGRRAGLSDPAARDPDKALAIAPGGGRLYLRVRGAGAATARYTLFVRREPGEPGQCVQDAFDRGGGRNDAPEAAWPLEDADDRRPGLTNGSVCDDAGFADDDWYRFRVPRPRTRLCVAMDFRHADGNLDVELYRADSEDGAPCRRDRDCRGEDPQAPAGRCVLGRCRGPLAAGASQTDWEVIALPKEQVDPGDYLLRVHGVEGARNIYDLQVTLVPEEPVCGRDWRERDQPNDAPEQATFLGAGRAAVCDAWLCHDERVAGDWYALHVPPGADRTALVAFAPFSDGVLLLTLVDPENPDAVVESFELQTSVQCINIRAGATPKNVYLGVSADAVVDDGDPRVDYILHVEPTDLTRNPRGACDRLSGGNFGHVAWPTADLR